MPPRESRMLGALFTRAGATGLIEATDRHVPSEGGINNRRPIRGWRSLLTGAATTSHLTALPGKAKVVYATDQEAWAWILRYLDGAQTSADLFDRAIKLMIVGQQTIAHAASAGRSSQPFAHRLGCKEAQKRLDAITKGRLPKSLARVRGALTRAYRPQEAACTRGSDAQARRRVRNWRRLAGQQYVDCARIRAMTAPRKVGPPYEPAYLLLLGPMGPDLQDSLQGRIDSELRRRRPVSRKYLRALTDMTFDLWRASLRSTTTAIPSLLTVEVFPRQTAVWISMLSSVPSTADPDVWRAIADNARAYGYPVTRPRYWRV